MYSTHYICEQMLQEDGILHRCNRVHSVDKHEHNEVKRRYIFNCM